MQCRLKPWLCMVSSTYINAGKTSLPAAFIVVVNNMNCMPKGSSLAQLAMIIIYDPRSGLLYACSVTKTCYYYCHSYNNLLLSLSLFTFEVGTIFLEAA